MLTQHIPVYARFQWLNHRAVSTVLARFLTPPTRGRKGYDRVWLFRWLIYKQLMGCSYRDLESLTGVDYSTFIKFRQRLITTNWFARVFKRLASLVAENTSSLSLILDSSFVAAYSGKDEVGAEYSGYYEATGFKLHQLIDEETRLPLRQAVSPGARADIAWGLKMIRAAPRRWKVSSLLADRGYDAEQLVWQTKQKWRLAKVGIPIRRTNQRHQDTTGLNYRSKATLRTLDPVFLNRRTEIERYFSRKKRVMNLGEERTRGLQNFRANCALTSIMEILEFVGTPRSIFILFTKLAILETMRFDLLTIFPGMFDAYLNESIIKRAQRKKLVSFHFHDLRDFTTDKHRSVDDRPYGGGPGMVMKAAPVVAALSSLPKNKKRRILLMSAKGKTFAQSDAKRLMKYKNIAIVCPRYEGVDERVLDYVDEEISIGNYVLTGGELPAMIVADAIIRLLPGVLGKDESSVDESHSEPGVLEYPQYTRPEVFRKKRVPKELLSGDHKNIAVWRRKMRRRI